MDFQVSIAGEAGQGIACSADLIAKDFASRGLYVFNYRDYGSLIRGGENFNLVRISDRPVSSNRWESDYSIILGRFSGHHADHVSRDGVCISTLQGAGNNFNAQPIISELNAPAIVANSALLGALYRAMGQPLEPLLEQMDYFGDKAGVNREAARRGYDYYRGPKKGLEVPPEKGARYYVSGSQAVALGAVAAGMDLYMAYPMTPATPVLHILAALEGHDIGVVQLENEIGVANAALGASYAGASTMVGTSSGGFALMTETFSLQGMSEVPLVVYLAMRPGPATGVPTYTAQSDLKFVLNGAHGEFPRVVVAPGDPLEAFERMAEVFYLSNKYRLLSVLLSDKHLAESGFTLDASPKFSVSPARFISKPKKSYGMNDSGVPPRGVPGDGIINATSYEHDEDGYTVEDAGKAREMFDNRLRKFRTVEKALDKLETVRTFGRGKDVVVGWGSTKGAIVDALNHLDGVKFLQVCYLRPFPAARVKRVLGSAERIALVENSATGQLADVVREQTGIDVTHKILKYDGRPFGERELAAKLKGVFR